MKTAPFSAAGNNHADQRRHALGIDTERLCPAPHFHARPFEIEIGIDANRQPRGQAQPSGDGERPRSLTFGFKVERHAMGNRRFQFRITLARPGKADPRAFDANAR